MTRTDVKIGRPNTTGIVLTFQPSAWKGTIHQCEGWIAKWTDGDRGITCWGRTRKAAYSRAYRFAKHGDAP